MLKYIEKFLVLFNRLKSEINNSLKNLKWIPNEKPEIAELCFQLDETYRHLNRTFANNSSKYLIAPPIFQKRWDEYIAYYQKKIDEIAKPLRIKYEKELHDLIEQLETDAKEKGKSLEDVWGSFANTTPIAMGATFNPLEDNAASLLDDLFAAVHDIVGNDILPDVFTDKQMGALNYFEKVIGLNFHDINRRWGKAPNLFISKNIKKKTDELIEMYNESVKSYIFGLNVASIAMCRALLEHILINYYGIPKDDLVKIISHAEKRFKKLKSLNLHKLRMDGNDILHEYEKKSKIEETVVANYLLTIRTLVDLIPE